MRFTVNDSVKASLEREAVTELDFDPPTQVFHTERPIEGLKGQFWSLSLHRVEGPAICVTIGTSVGHAKATGIITIAGMTEKFEHTFTQAGKHVVLDQAWIYHVVGQFIVTVWVKFEIPEEKLSKLNSLNLSVFKLIAESQQDVTDAEFRFVEGTIKVHRGFMSMISPVFYAMFSHDTKEAKTGVVNITDFDMKTAKSVIDLCYGRNMGTESVPEVVDMLHFADKYDIKAVVKKLEAIIEADIDKANFCAVTQYAFDLDRDKLKKVCGEYYRKNLDLPLSPEFVRMSVAAQVGVIAVAASIDSPTSDKK